MEFRLLGSVEVDAAGVSVPLGGPKPKALLAALLLELGRVVPVDRLIDVLWGEDPPRTARDVVQTYVKSLRRALSEHDLTEVIVTEPPGYAACVPAEALDVHVFTELVSQARRSTDPERTATLLREALALWRGRALAGLEHTLLAGAAARLEELRLRAIEERIDADLALGREAELVPELTSLVAQHPTNERIRAQLMITLYRLGRQGDALAAYREGREALIDALGIEPGPDLNATHAAILRNEASLRRRPSPPHGAVPSQLPLVPADFTGRAKEIASLVRDLPGRLQVIAGAAGTGKSTLAAYVAHQVSASYPDGQLYADLRGMSEAPPEPAEVLGRFLRALGLPSSELPNGTDERAELFRTMVTGRRVLLVLDDAHNEQQVRLLLPGSATCAVIIASRSRLSGLPGTNLIALDVLPADDAIALLSRLVGEGRVSEDRASAESVVACCGRLPLALRIAAARLTSRRGLPLRWLAGRLVDESRRLHELTAGDLGVRASIGLSYDGLDVREQRTLRRLGFLGVPEFGPDLVERLTGLSNHDAERSVESLVDAQLAEFSAITASGYPRYRLHDLVRLFAVERAEQEEPAGSLRACVECAIQGWLTLAQQAAVQVSQDRPRLHALADIPAESAATSTDAEARFAEDQPALVVATQRAAALGMHELICGFAAEELSTVFIRAGRVELRDRMVGTVLAAARHAGNVRAEATMLANLGQLRYMQDQFRPARHHLAEAMAKFRQIGDVPRQIAMLAGLGTACRDSGWLVEAIHFLDEARALLKDVDDPINLGDVLRLCGSVQLERGEFEPALSNLELSLAAYRAAGSRHGEGLTVRTLGLYHRARGELEMAQAHCAAAMEIFRELGDEWLEAYAVRAQAKVWFRLGRCEEALPPLEWALSVCQRAADRWGQGATLHVLGQLHLASGRLDLAETFFDAAMSIWQTMETPLWMARTRYALSCLYEARGETQRATQIYAEAIKAFRDHGSREYRELVREP